MIIDYVGVKEINGSLVVIDGVKGVSYEEIVDIRLEDGTKRQGRVVEIQGERIVVQDLKVQDSSASKTQRQDLQANLWRCLYLLKLWVECSTVQVSLLMV